MAELFGVLTGVVGVVDVGARVGQGLWSLRRKWMNAPLELLALRNEVTDLNILLNHVRDSCEFLEDDETNRHFVIDLDELIQRARLCLEDVESKLNPLQDLEDWKKRAKWLHIKTAITTKVKEFKIIRNQITTLLQTNHIKSTSRIKLQLESVHLENQKASHLTMETLQSLDQKFDRIEDYWINVMNSAAKNEEALFNLDQTVTNSLERLIRSEMTISKYNSNESQAFFTTPKYISAKTLPSIQNTFPNSSSYETWSQDMDLGQTFSIWARYRNGSCPRSCKCFCHSHKIQSQTWKTPRFLNKLIGSLFVSYTGFPTWKQKCDNISCHRHRSRTIEAVYEFPIWCLNWNIHAFANIEAIGNPAIHLVFRQRITFSIGSIFHAVDSNNIDLLKSILNRYPDSVNFRLQKSGQTALHIACLRPRKISFQIFQLLLRAGASLNAENDDGRSVASTIGCQIIQGQFPKQHQTEITKWGSVWKFIEDLELSMITEVALGFRVGNINSLLYTIPPTQLRLTENDSTGSTPLLWAARIGNLSAAQSLVKYGVDINIKSAKGNTPLIGSFAFDHGPDCFAWLLENGADPYMTNKDGFNAFTLACYLGRLDLVKHMLSLSMDPNTRDGKNRSGIDRAIDYDHDQILNCLINAGADFNVYDDSGIPLIGYAVWFNSHKCLRLLLERNINYLVIGRQNWTILHCAAHTGDLETFEILADHGLRGLDYLWRDSNGLTAEEMFFARRMNPSEKLTLAFQNLLSVVEEQTNRITLESSSNSREEPDQFFDAVEFIAH